MIGWISPVGRAALSPWARAYRQAWSNPGDAQARVRDAVWASVRESAYGAQFRRFDDLPIVGWADVAPWMARQAAGEGAIVTSEPVLFWEPTSGSGGAPKRVPYTASLRRSFSRMVAVWVHDLLTDGPPLRTGRVYFSVTPRFHDVAPSADGVPVGTADDRDYLDGPLRALLSPFFRSPPGAAAIRDPEAWRRCVATWLCGEVGLEVISVWSPTFLTVLLDWIEAHRDELPHRDRIGDWRRLWPSLRLISCWDAGASAAPAAALAARFPGVMVQGKGLLATEAPITVPLVSLPDAGAPLVDDVVIELLDARGDLRPLSAAESGASYELVVSQTAGLVRYRLGDIVEVRGRSFATPALRFVGRAATVDLAGEKLTEGVVAAALARAGAPPGSGLVAESSGYRLEVDADAVPVGLAHAVDAALTLEHHYRLARDLGQLRPIHAVAVPGRSRQAAEAAPVWGGAKPSVLRVDSAIPGTPR
jgi:hypothetical protein